MKINSRLLSAKTNPTFIVYMLAALVAIAMYVWSSLATIPRSSALEINNAELRLTNLKTGEVSDWQKVTLPLAPVNPWSKYPEQYEVRFSFDTRDFDTSKLYLFSHYLPHGGSLYLNNELLDTTALVSDAKYVTHVFHPFLAHLNVKGLQTGRNELKFDITVQNNITTVLSSVWIGSRVALRGALFSELDATRTLKTVSIVLLLIMGIFSFVVLITENRQDGDVIAIDGAKKIIYMSFGLFIYIEFFFPTFMPTKLLGVLTSLQLLSLTGIISGLFYAWMMLLDLTPPRKFKLFFLIPTFASVLALAFSLADKSIVFLILSAYLLIFYILPAVKMFEMLLKNSSSKSRAELISLIFLYVIVLPIVLHDLLLVSNLIFPLQDYLINVLRLPEFWTSGTPRLNYIAPPVIVAFMAYVLVRLVKYSNLQRMQNVALEKKVGEREADLEISYEQIKAQDIHIARLNERSRIMRDLHDVLGSTLTIGTLKTRSTNFSIAEAGHLFQKAIDELRLILNGFSGERILLDNALETLADQTKRLLPKDANLELSVLGDTTNISYDKGMHVVRIIQESLTNIIKYAHAKNITITLRCEDNALIVEIADDGVPFDYQSAISKGSGRGLVNIKKRTHEINGAISYHRKDEINYLVLVLSALE